MKRPHHYEELDSGADGESDAHGFDDGDDLMARAASMMGFDDEDDSEDSDDSEEAAPAMSEDEDKAEPSAKKQKVSKDRKKGKKRAIEDVLPDDENEEVQSVLQMKIDALLSSVRCPGPSSAKAKPLNNFIERLRITLANIPERKPLPAFQAASALKAPLPFSDPATNLQTVNWQLGFQRPSKVEVGGSWSYDAACKWKGQKGWNVDVHVQMPETLFQEKDVKDNRYFYKRAYFLAVLQEALQASNSCASVDIFYLAGNQRKPVLELTPKSDNAELDFSKLRCCVRIIPNFDWSVCPFTAARLGPSRDNLRVLQQTSQTSQSEVTSLPSPIYNSDIALDGGALPSTNYLKRIAGRSDTFARAAVLLKVWALQRGIDKEFGLSHCLHVLAILLAYTLDGSCKGVKSIPAGSGVWQAFKACLDTLAHLDSEKSQMIASTFVRHDKAPVATEWQSYKGCVLTDPTGVSNLLAQVPASALDLLRYEAQLSVRKLKSGEALAFDIILLGGTEQAHLRFDQMARIQVPLSVVKQQLPSDLPSQAFSMAHKIGTLLKIGLSSRAKAISLSLVEDPKSADTILSLGLYLEPAQIQRLVEYGPPADNKPEAKRFRELWGSKAETRKFRDGRILESVVWNAEGPTQRTQIFANLIQHLLSHHLGLPTTNIHFFASAYDALLAEASQVRNALYSADPQETGFSPITAAFDYMVKELQELKDLPLQITSVIPVSEGLRYTTPFVPGAVRIKGLPSISTSANYLPLHDCHIVFEGSGKWPEDLAAIQKIKSAFLARLALSLPRAIPGCRTEMQFDVTAGPTNDSSSLVVILPQGFVFRLRIHHDRERTLMEDVLLNEEQEETVRKSTQASLVRHHKRFTALPNHHNAISALQSRHSSYSTTVRITKRWLAAHCLAIHLPAELVELVCARVYLNAEDQYEVPATGTLGFARVLHVLSSWKWREEPLLVPIFSAPNVHEAEMVATFPSQLKIKALQKFNALRKADPSISRSAWYVATEKDLGGRSWGELAPSKLVAGRVQLLAQLCLQAISVNMYTGNAQVQHLFVPDLDSYDFLLYLDVAKVSKHLQAVKPLNKELAKRPATPQVIRPGFDGVASYLQHLQSFCGDVAMLFYDQCGGTVIGGLFNPSLTAKERAFRIALDFPSAPASTEAQQDDSKSKQAVHLDRAAFVDHLVRMSDGLVENAILKAL